MQIRIGVDSGRRAVLRNCAALNAPILVSANSLWDNNRKVFSGYESYQGHDTALDSGGFVAMKRYGGYRWTVEQYVRLAKNMHPTWWAQMDYCCEPEIAGSQSAVWKRIDFTVESLHECQAVAARHNTPAPLPVLQGWHPEDYCQGPIYDWGFNWPKLVGIGSVCRRHVHGPDGILAVIGALHEVVPPHVKFHLFGVKSQALALLVQRFPTRIHSMDSMAWNRAARWDVYHGRIPGDGESRAQVMVNWYLKQKEILKTI